MKQKEKECKRCGELRQLYARRMCKHCDKLTNPHKHGINLRVAKPLSYVSIRKPVAINKRSKKGIEMSKMDVAFYKGIWNKRLHCSEVSNVRLGDAYNPVFFSHILTKAAFPRFRHKEENIVLMTFEEHQEWEFGDRSTPEFKQKFKGVLQLYAKLVQDYYK